MSLMGHKIPDGSRAKATLGRSGKECRMRWNGLKLLIGLVFSSTTGCGYVEVPLGRDELGGERPGDGNRTVRGAIVGTAAGDEPVEVGVVWFPVHNHHVFGDYDTHAIVAQTVGVTPESSVFALELDESPPPEAFSTYGYDDGVNPPSEYLSPLVRGAIVVLRARHARSTYEIFPEDILGFAPDRGVLYFTHDGNDAPDGPLEGEVDGVAEWLGVSPTRGYHLYVKEVSDEERFRYRECVFRGLCVDSLHDQDPFVEVTTDLDYARCVEEHPDAQRCSFSSLEYSHPEALTPEQRTENARCYHLATNLPPSRNCQLEAGHPRNQSGFDLEVSVPIVAKPDLFQWYLEH
jgi:hypothetical protein